MGSSVYEAQALVAELVDAQHSGCCARTGVVVRALYRAPWFLLCILASGVRVLLTEEKRGLRTPVMLGHCDAEPC